MSYSLILNTKVFKVPLNSPYLNDVDPNIYSQLITNHEYRVKSKVSEQVFESFIDNWINCQILNITEDKIVEFSLLSEEFDRKQDLITLYSNFIKRIKENDKKKSTKKEYLNSLKEKRAQKSQNYQQIIQILFKKTGNDIYYRFSELKKTFFDACKNEYIKYIDLLTRKTVEKDGLVYVLDEQNQTAGVYNVNSTREEILIPKSVFYESKEFIVTAIIENSFYYKSKVKSVKFAEDSKLRYIDKNSFSYCSIEHITIPSTVNFIGQMTFFHCDKLKSVTFPEDSELECFSQSAFASSSIETINIPPRVSCIGNSCFHQCYKLSSVEISKNSQLKTIEEDAFAETWLGKIDLPSTIVDLKPKWCRGSPSLKNISVFNQPGKEENIRYVNDAFIIGKSNLSSKVFDVLIFVKPNAKNVEIPDYIKIIRKDAFKEAKVLIKVEFSEDSELEMIDDEIFIESSISSITIPPSIKRIGKSAFKGCKYLKSVEFLPDSQLNLIDRYAFENSGIEKFIVPRSVEKIDKFAFYTCKKLATIQFHENSVLNTIDDCAFANSSINSFSVPRSVTEIGHEAFSGCTDLKKIDFPEDVKMTKFGPRVFANSSIKSLTIPQSIEKLEVGWCEQNGSLVEINVHPNNQHFKVFENQFLLRKTKTVGDEFDAISFCVRNVRKVTIPSFVRIIDPFAFSMCRSLSKVTFDHDSKLERIGENAFEMSRINEVIFPSHLNCIDQRAFSQCSSLERIEFPSNSRLEKISEYAFNRTILDVVSIPSNVVEISQCAFSESRLEKIKFSNDSKLKKIGKGAFNECEFKSICIPSSVVKIGKRSFNRCYNLKNVVFQNNSNLKCIGKNVFESNELIRSITIPSGVICIDCGAFQFCEKLAKVKFDSNSKLEKIGKNAFTNTAIESISIPSNVSDIGHDAFSRCKHLFMIEIGQNLNNLNFKKIFDDSRNYIIMVPAGNEINYKNDY